MDTQVWNNNFIMPPQLSSLPMLKRMGLCRRVNRGCTRIIGRAIYFSDDIYEDTPSYTYVKDRSVTIDTPNSAKLCQNAKNETFVFKHFCQKDRFDAIDLDLKTLSFLVRIGRRSVDKDRLHLYLESLSISSTANLIYTHAVLSMNMKMLLKPLDPPTVFDKEQFTAEIRIMKQKLHQWIDNYL